MKHRMLVTIGALVVMSCALAYALTATAEISFPFMAGKKAFPAGKYVVELPDPSVISISGPGGRATMVVLTRLGRHDKDTDCEFVFDKVGDQFLLSEVWFPGGDDGYLVLATKQAHEHAVVGGSNPKK